MISRKVVYVHKLKEDAEVEGKHFKSGKILYIGSGHKRRVVAKVNRTQDHILLWDKLDKEILADDLSLEQAYELEQKLVLEHWDSFLLNKKKIIDKVKTYKFEELDNIFYIDEEYILRWNHDRKSGNGGVVIKAGTAAGYPYREGYMTVSINRVNYAVHRIIWCLYNKQNVPAGMVIDHIDRNPANNSPSNLRLVSHSQNQQNKSSRSNTGHKHITYHKDRQYFSVQVSTKMDFVERRFVYGIKSLVNNGQSYEDAYNSKLKEALDIRDALLSQN